MWLPIRISRIPPLRALSDWSCRRHPKSEKISSTLDALGNEIGGRYFWVLKLYTYTTFARSGSVGGLSAIGVYFTLSGEVSRKSPAFFLDALLERLWEDIP